jgi:hypothetical protein
VGEKEGVAGVCRCKWTACVLQRKDGGLGWVRVGGFGG